MKEANSMKLTKTIALSALLIGFAFQAPQPTFASKASCDKKQEKCLDKCDSDNPDDEGRFKECDNHCQKRFDICLNASKHKPPVEVEQYHPPVVVEPYPPPVVVEPYPPYPYYGPWWGPRWHHRHWR
jgi:hypothetical protein